MPAWTRSRPQRTTATRLLVAGAVLATAAVAPQTVTAAEANEVRIVRDGFGVPHVYSETIQGVSYGAGYAIAVDRLFQLDVLRANGKGRFTELFGPVPGFPEADAAARRLFYTDEERQAKYDRYPARLKTMVSAYVAGINQRISEVRSNPSLLPQEYTTFGLGQPAPWHVTDTVAIADALVQQFGAGGGSERAQADLLKHLVEKFGAAEGQKAFDDAKWRNDPASPASIPADVKWEKEPTGARALPPKQWRKDARLGLPADQRGPVADAPAQPPRIGTLAQLSLIPDRPSQESVRAFAEHQRGVEELGKVVKFGSNALIAAGKRVQSGGTLQLGAPQVGQFAPQIIAEHGLHAPKAGLDMTGLTFAGSGPVVLIGRGPDFAFTTTTGNSDGSDIYVEQLAKDAAGKVDPKAYVYDGKVYRMDCRTETIRTRGGLPHSTTEVCRTRNGPVLSTDTANGVAYSLRRSWYDFETGTVEGFSDYNFARSLEDFATAANKLQSNHNMFYTDAKGRSGYWHPGALPLRAPGTDVRLPQDGSSSATEWRRMRTAQEVPHLVDPKRGWLANWNNKPAVSWDNGDGANYGAVFRSRLFDQLLAADRSLTLEDVERINRVNGTTELEFAFFRDHIVRSGLRSSDPEIRTAAEHLSRWDGRREDNDGDDKVDSEPGYSLWKSWRSIALKAAFDDELGPFLSSASDSMLLHVLDGRSASLVKSRDYLNGKTRDAFLDEVMRANLDALAKQFGTKDVRTYRSAMPKQHYTRLNVRFYDCEVARAAGRTEGCADFLPGNVESLDLMNRGTYNHIVEFRPGAAADATASAGTGESWVERRPGFVVEAESIISPGQSGHIDQTGRQSPHYEDQHRLYGSWRYKPMPLREADVASLGGATTTLTYQRK